MAPKEENIEKGEYVIGIAILLAAILISASVYLSATGIEKAVAALKLQASAPTSTQQASQQIKLYIISDRRCADCAGLVEQILPQLRSVVQNLDVEQYDYSDSKGKALYIQSGGDKYLPLFLFEPTIKSSASYAQLAQFLDEAGQYLSLRIGSEFDPEAEICGNGIDDDKNGATDCQDSECKSDISCIEKLDKPKVEVFVMSYCPYGIQMQKGMLPVVDLLGDKVDWNVRFVSYIMHGETEAYENQLQYCLQLQNKSKYFKYLSCFLNNSKSEECLATIDIDKKKLQSCLNETDSKFNITANLKNTATYLSGRYPLFLVDDAENKKYGVQGSPTFVINGVVNEQQGRDPQSILRTVCMGFKNPPAECSKQLSSQAYVPGFGFSYQASGAVAAGACG
ncbi:MAG: hypothetical protein N3G80_02985 [Candidatus Micrarchaeota archaeon]|nr:hypothetical protein [Candidatus Micrarchaeota archaeon]